MALLRVAQLAIGIVLAAQAKPDSDGEPRINQSIYRVPPGTRAVVRDVRCVVLGQPTGGTVAVWVLTPEGAAVWIRHFVMTGATIDAALTGQIVLNAGDELWLYSAPMEIHYLVSGAEMPVPG